MNKHNLTNIISTLPGDGWYAHIQEKQTDGKVKHTLELVLAFLWIKPSAASHSMILRVGQAADNSLFENMEGFTTYVHRSEIEAQERAAIEARSKASTGSIINPNEYGV